MIKLTLTDEQARAVSTACEVYARIRMGQFKEIVWQCLDLSKPDFCERQDTAEAFLMSARCSIYPDLTGWGHSYGIGKFKDADQAFDVYQVLRKLWGDEREPFSYYPLPKVEVDDEKIERPPFA